MFSRRLQCPAAPNTPLARIARQQIEHHVDRLIALLDALDAAGEELEPDTDLEPGEAGDPNACWLDSADGHRLSAAVGGAVP